MGLQLSRVHAEGQEAKDLLHAAIARIQGVGAVQAELRKISYGTVDLVEYLPNLVRAAIQADSNVTLLVEAAWMISPLSPSKFRKQTNELSVVAWRTMHDQAQLFIELPALTSELQDCELHQPTTDLSLKGFVT